jgi:hypothetical protein
MSWSAPAPAAAASRQCGTGVRLSTGHTYILLGVSICMAYNIHVDVELYFDADGSILGWSAAFAPHPSFKNNRGGNFKESCARCTRGCEDPGRREDSRWYWSMRLGRRQLTHDDGDSGGGGDGQRDATIDDGGLAPGRTQKVEATIDGPRPQQQAKDTLSPKEKRAQTGAGGQVRRSRGRA